MSAKSKLLTSVSPKIISAKIPATPFGDTYSPPVSDKPSSPFSEWDLTKLFPDTMVGGMQAAEWRKAAGNYRQFDVWHDPRANAENAFRNAARAHTQATLGNGYPTKGNLYC